MKTFLLILLALISGGFLFLQCGLVWGCLVSAVIIIRTLESA